MIKQFKQDKIKQWQNKHNMYFSNILAYQGNEEETRIRQH